MSNEQQTTPTPKQQRQQTSERAPIPIAKLIIASSNPNGVMVPWGMNGETEKQQHRIVGGINGGEKIDIEWRPWMRMYRIARSRKITETHGGQEVIRWEPMGPPYLMPETWAVAVPVSDL